MIFGDNFIWIHNPKVAGTVIRKQLAQHGQNISGITKNGVFLAHMTQSQIEQLFPEIHQRFSEIPSFMLVRDPLARFVSAWQYLSMACLYPVTSPAHLLQLVREGRAPHAMPQHLFAHERTIILHLEAVTGESLMIGGVTVDMSQRTNWTQPTYQPDRAMVDQVREVYAVDYERYGYD